MANDEFRKLIEDVFPEGIEKALARRQIERFQQSWSEQPRPERKLRMRYVLQMAVELEEIRKTENFATGLCEMAIEDVITGDFRSLEDAAAWLSEKEFFYNVGDEARKGYAALFAKFREICEEACIVFGPKTEKA